MSILGAMKKYEKMLENPKNRVNSSGTIHQPTPGDIGIQNPHPVNEGVSAEDTAMFAAVDARMGKKSSSEVIDTPAPVNESRIQKLEKDVSELKDLMMDVMKAHMKLIEK